MKVRARGAQPRDQGRSRQDRRQAQRQELHGACARPPKPASSTARCRRAISPTLLTDGGFEVDRNQIALNVPIKTIGLHKVPVAAASGSRGDDHDQRRAQRRRGRAAGARRERDGAPRGRRRGGRSRGRRRPRPRRSSSRKRAEAATTDEAEEAPRSKPAKANAGSALQSKSCRAAERRGGCRRRSGRVCGSLGGGSAAAVLLRRWRSPAARSGSPRGWRPAGCSAWPRGFGRRAACARLLCGAASALVCRRRSRPRGPRSARRAGFSAAARAGLLDAASAAGLRRRRASAARRARAAATR